MPALGTNITLIARGFPHAFDEDYVQISDPCVFRLSNRWNMLFTSRKLSDGKYYCLGAHLDEGDGLDSTDWIYDGVKLAPGAAGTWDSLAIECPHYAGVARDPINPVSTVHRMYYTGYSSSSPPNYAIGYATLAGNQWVRRKSLFGPSIIDPVVGPENTSQGSICGDQVVGYIPGTALWNMWYQTLIEAPQSPVGIATVRRHSTDGENWSARQVVGWTPQETFPTLPGGPYYLDVREIRGKYWITGFLFRSLASEWGIWTAKKTAPNNPAETPTWYPLLWQSDSTGLDWFDLNDPVKAVSPGSDRIGLFSSNMVWDGTNLWLFFHSVVDNGQGGNVAHIGRASLPASLVAAPPALPPSVPSGHPMIRTAGKS